MRVHGTIPESAHTFVCMYEWVRLCSFIIIKDNLVRIIGFAGSTIDGAQIEVQLARPPNQNHGINKAMENSYPDLKTPLGPQSVQTNIADIRSMSNNNIYGYEPQVQQQVYTSQTEVSLWFDYELQFNKDLLLVSW